MIQFKDFDKKFISDNFNDADEIMSSKDVDFVLNKLDGLIMQKGFINYEKKYNDFGLQAMRVFDSIYYNN
ncbi:MAG: hypothetical protein AAGU14_05605 [Eubacteriaceae bacterium]